jgi:flagellar hook-associated protein 1 FlgK
MSDILIIGTSALQSYTSAMATISNNIANANTPGYSRERTNLQDIPGTTTSVIGGIGSGVTVQSVERLTSGTLQTQLVTDSSDYGRINTLSTYASQLDSWLSGGSTGMSVPLQTFFGDLNTLSQSPTSSAARQAVMTDAQGLVSSFSNMQSNLLGMETQVNSNVSNTITQINNYAQQLASVNQQIARQTVPGGQAPNALLDQQQQLLQQLGGQIGISTIANANGTVNVYIGTGQPLVTDSGANTMSVQPDQYGQNPDIVINTGGNVSSIVTQQISGGQLGGLLDYRREILEPAIDQVGLMAVAVSNAVNTQQTYGMDQYGQLGQPLFTTPLVSTSASSKNTGAATVTATVANPNQLDASDYALSFDGVNWTLTDQNTGAQTVMAGAGTAGSPLTGDGLSIVLGGGGAAAGDTFLVQPTKLAAGSIAMTTTDPARIAAASPVQTSAAAANTGTGIVSGATITNPADPNLLTPTSIVFTSPTTYSINGGPSQAYVSGTPIVGTGWTVTISGVPATNDTFTVSANNGSSTDNTNAVLLAGLINQKILGNGTNSIASANTSLVTSVGSQAQQAQAQFTAVNAQQQHDTAAQQSISGVNLDEEAAALTQFQQAYQAAAQIISTSNSLFQSLLSAVHS